MIEEIVKDEIGMIHLVVSVLALVFGSQVFSNEKRNQASLSESDISMQ